MYNNTTTNRKSTKIIISLFLVFCIFIISLAIWQQVSRIGKIEVEVKYAPYSARVEVDGKRVKNDHQVYLEPGNHEIKVTQKGFDDLEQNLEINEATEYIYGFLEPNSEEGREIYQKKRSEFLEIEGLYSMAAVKSGEEQRAKWPIIDYLPINNAIYSIGYTIKQDDHFSIIIDTSDSYFDSAIRELKNIKQNTPLAEYDITIKGLRNPFKNQFVDNNTSNPLEFLRQGYQNVACTINEGIRSDNYYYTTITTGSAEEFNIVTYRVLIENINNEWRVISTPYPLLTIYNTPSVSTQILTAVNNL